MQSLLRWGIENTDQSQDGSTPQPPPQPRHYDPELIDAILGKPDAVLMKEAMVAAADESREESDRIVAFNNFEMLIEQIDNANNIEPLKLWEPLLDLLSSPSDAIRANALGVIGTAIQNNPTAQLAFMAREPLPQVLSLLSASNKSSSPKVRSKAAYCLSAALKHNTDAVRQMDTRGGWDILRDALQDSNITVRQKTAFLLNTLLLQDGETSPSENVVHQGPQNLNLPPPAPVTLNTTTSGTTRVALQNHGIVLSLLESLESPVPHGPDGDKGRDVDYEDYEEKAARTVYMYLEKGGKLTEKEKVLLRSIIERHQPHHWDLGEEEWGVLKNATN